MSEQPTGQTGPESDEVPALPWRQCKGCGGSGFWMTSTIFGQDEDVCDLCDGIGAVPDDDL